MTDIYIAIYIFILGIVLGSFYNVVIYRTPKEESLVFPHSHCTNCNERLRPLDLFPVFSYLFLRGKCRYCGNKISIRYPLVELFTGVIFLTIYLIHGLSIDFIKYIILASLMLIIGMIDYDTTDVYLRTTLPGIVAGVILIAVKFVQGDAILTYIWGGLLAGGVIAIIILLTSGMGWGDAEICFLSGLYLGFSKSIVMIMLSFIIGGLIGIILIITKIKSRKDYMPFGPFISIATLITILFGNKIINWYLSFLS